MLKLVEAYFQPRNAFEYKSNSEVSDAETKMSPRIHTFVYQQIFHFSAGITFCIKNNK